MNAAERQAARDSIPGLLSVADAFDRKGMPAGAKANRILAAQTAAALDAIDRVLALHPMVVTPDLSDAKGENAFPGCDRCPENYPCATVQAIEGAS